MDRDGNVALGYEDEALAMGLRDERRGDLVEPGKEPGAQQEAGDVAALMGDAGAVGDEVIALDRVVPQALRSRRRPRLARRPPQPL